MQRYGRRRVLTLCGTAMAALAGCTEIGDDDSEDEQGTANRLTADGVDISVEAEELVVEELADGTVVRIEEGFGMDIELESEGESVSLPPGIYPVNYDTEPDETFSGEETLGTVQVGEVTFTVDSWEEGTAALENAAIESSRLVQEDPDEQLIAEFTLEIDAVVGQMLVFPAEEMESEADVVLNQPGATYGFFVYPDRGDEQGQPPGEDITDVYEPGTYTLVVDSEPNVGSPSDGIVAIDRIEFYAGRTHSIRERGG